MLKLIKKLDLNIRAMIQEPEDYFEAIRRNEFVFDEVDVIYYDENMEELGGTCFIFGPPGLEPLSIEEKVEALQEAINEITK